MSLNTTQHPKPNQRKIIHCDCDCFFAAVEIRDDPSLAGLPIAVGGAAGKRGVLTTCSYEARDFGIHSAMPTAEALRRCPDLIVLPVAMSKYQEASKRVKEIFLSHTELIEPLSLDEAFLDVSDVQEFQGSGTLIAENIRRRVRAEVGITISAGVAPNKFLAKIASDWKKPDGLTVIRPEEVEEFVRKLAVDKIFGVGKVTAKKMQSLGIQSCEDLQQFSQIELHQRFGRFGLRLFELCRGIDNRLVSSSRERKSLSVERTLGNDLPDEEACAAYLQELKTELEQRLTEKSSSRRIQKLFVKLKFNDFTQTTAESIHEKVDLATLEQLLSTAFARKSLPVRLIGLGVRFSPEQYQQMELF